MIGHAAHERADILRLLGVWHGGVKLILARKLGKALAAQPFIQQLLHRLVGKAQLVRQMHGDLSCSIANHRLLVLFSLLL